MGTTLPGIQRITQAETRRRARSALDAMAAHRKVCARCQRVKDDPYAYCDEGWGLAKAETAARYARWKLDQPPGDDQGTLF